MKKFYYFSAVVTMAVTMLCGTSCQEEEVKVSNGDLTNGKISEVINKDSVLTIDGKRMEWNINITPQKKSISKGMIIDEKTYYEIDLKDYFPNDYEITKTITYNHKNKDNTTTKYKINLLRIDRRTEPGKYFYVMTENLNVELDTACWLYGDKYDNIKYGRLYTWHSATELAKKIRINLPVYFKNEPTRKKFKTEPLVKARLLSVQDVKDIIESDYIGNMPYNGYTIDDNFNAPEHEIANDFQLYYYDAFLCGLLKSANNKPDELSGQKSLGGYRDTQQHPESEWKYYEKGWYTSLNENGLIWLSDNSIPNHPEWEPNDCHLPLYIEKNSKYNYTAFINVGRLNKYGFSVRYVFEPRYE
jgi:hypothetical protein